MLHYSFDWQDLRGEIFCEISEKPFPPEDCFLLDERDNRLRIAVIDGAGNTHYRRDYAGVSTGTWSSGVVCTALRSSASIEHCLFWANRVLFDRYAPPGRSQMVASCVALDIYPDGSSRAVRAGDCWLASRQRSWRRIFYGDARSEKTLAAFAQESSFSDLDKGRQFRAEEKHFSDSSQWSSTQIGYFPEPHFQSKNLGSWKSLMIGSDGIEPNKSAKLEDLASCPAQSFASVGDQTLVLLDR